MVRTGEMRGWLCIALFGFMLVVSCVCMLPNATYLRLTPEGFTICSMFRAHTYKWQDVSWFAVGRVFVNKAVMFNFSPSYQRTRHLRALNVDLVGYEAALPDSYGLTYEELADVLNHFKASSNT